MESLPGERLFAARTPVDGRRCGRRILLAEDDGSFRYLLARTLRKDGYRIITVATGVDLVDILSDSLSSDSSVGRFDLVLSDVRMPGWQGISALAGFRGHPDMPPFILFTAFGDEETHRRALELGALALLDKPFDIDDLRGLVAEALDS
ncbi:MAG: response regulator [Deltaproteobacteria bacterium]|jgi:CheY-like chemotaxis protein|nr:response regulator [Deltaproteobacteria bacterium]